MSSGWRKAYYGQLGVQVVDVTPSIEQAMNDEVLDLDKLQKLCYWVRIPHHYRTRVWNVLLGVRPTLRDLWTFVDTQHEQLYTDLKDGAAAVFGELPEGLTEVEEQVEVLVRMAVLQYVGNDLHRTHAKAPMPDPSSPALRHLHHISRALLSISDHQPVPAYWLFIAFLQSQSGRSGKFPPVLFSQDRTEQVRSIYREVKATERILAESGDQGRLVAHRLKSLGIKLDDLLLGNFMSYFSDILPDQCLERIWDIILGGSRDIVSYTATALLIALRKKLEDATSGQELLEEAERGTLVKGLDMDAVVQTGITIWERSQPQYSIFRSGSSPGAGVGGAAGMQR